MKSGKESSEGEDSHNPGQNCFTCHHDKSNKASKYWWYIAGTVYDKDGDPANGEGAVELWTEPNRTGVLLNSLPIDQTGNIYTEKIFSFKGGFYPVLVDDDGKLVKSMSSKTTNGACNSCHGVTEKRIELD